MVFFMATFSGDVQYTQNGTFTNPCYTHCNTQKMVGLYPPSTFSRYLGPLGPGR